MTTSRVETSTPHSPWPKPDLHVSVPRGILLLSPELGKLGNLPDAARTGVRAYLPRALPGVPPALDEMVHFIGTGGPAFHVARSVGTPDPWKRYALVWV